jgi:hypothetical protein
MTIWIVVMALAMKESLVAVVVIVLLLVVIKTILFCELNVRLTD